MVVVTGLGVDGVVGNFGVVGDGWEGGGGCEGGRGCGILSVLSSSSVFFKLSISFLISLIGSTPPFPNFDPVLFLMVPITIGCRLVLTVTSLVSNVFFHTSVILCWCIFTPLDGAGFTTSLTGSLPPLGLVALDA